MVLVRKHERKRLLGRPRRRWEDNIKMGIEEIAQGRGVVRYGSGQKQMAGFCEQGNEISGYINYGERHIR